jgi:hypothetical protein
MANTLAMLTVARSSGGNGVLILPQHYRSIIFSSAPSPTTIGNRADRRRCPDDPLLIDHAFSLTMQLKSMSIGSTGEMFDA